VDDPNRIYELLLDYCSSSANAERILIGLVWTLCQSDSQTGLCMSPQIPTRTLPWSGDLAGKTLTELSAWITAWDPYQAAVGLAAINCCLSGRAMPATIRLENTQEHANLAVFDYFLPKLTNQTVVVIGRYPGLERYADRIDLTVLEKHPAASDLPDSACEFLIPKADWVFLTASSIANKTFPRLAELAANAKTVLMGPSMPWLPQLHEFGIDFLAGVEVTEPELLYRTVAEGGGRRIFNHGLCYRVAELTADTCTTWLTRQIADCVAEKARLTESMERWYRAGNNKRFSEYPQLERVNTRLSRMDSSYQLLWDRHGKHSQTVGGTLA
jgi:uncharacterized protein (DUF4213/DUF364 family)